MKLELRANGCLSKKRAVGDFSHGWGADNNTTKIQT
jgi:hypothetical protein